MPRSSAFHSTATLCTLGTASLRRAKRLAESSLAMSEIPVTHHRLCENQVIQSQLAQAEARLRSARAFLLSVFAETWEAVGETGELSLEQNTMIRLASTWAIHQAREVVNTLYHGAGATAIFDDHPFERRFRDMHTALQQAQGRQAHYQTIGRGPVRSRA
jgi:alkylation response protein AidB-like acyl-CoA dehydrogenase